MAAVRIEWASGHMDIDPAEAFEKVNLSNLRKLLRLSVISDVTLGTRTVPEWRRAVANIRDESFNAFYEAERTNDLRQIRELDRIKQKLDKCTAYLDELVKKYKVKE